MELCEITKRYSGVRREEWDGDCLWLAFLAQGVGGEEGGSSQVLEGGYLPPPIIP